MRNSLIVLGICAALAAISLFVPSALNIVFDVLDLVLGWMGPFMMVTVVSIAVGIVFLLMFPHLSAQRAIKAVKDKVKFNLIAIRLYQDNLGSVLKSTGGTLGWNFAYLGLFMIPMVVMAIPFMIVWFQLNALYAYSPLEPGDQRLVRVELAKGVEAAEVSLVQPEWGEEGPGWSIVVDRIKKQGPQDEAFWMLKAEREGSFPLTFRYGDQEITKEFVVGEDPGRLTRIRTSDPKAAFLGMKDPIVFFAETVLPADSFIQTVEYDLPAAKIGGPFEGEIGIMLWYMVVSIVAAFGLKGVFGVEF